MTATPLTVLRAQPGEPGNPDPDSYTVDSEYPNILSIPSSSLVLGHRYLTLTSASVYFEDNATKGQCYLRNSDNNARWPSTMRVGGNNTLNAHRCKQYFSGDLITISSLANDIYFNVGEFDNTVGLVTKATFHRPSMVMIDLDTHGAFENNGASNPGDWWHELQFNYTAVGDTWTNQASLEFYADGVSDYLVFGFAAMEGPATNSGGVTTIMMKMLLDSTTLLGFHDEVVGDFVVTTTLYPLHTMSLLKATGTDGGHGIVIPALTAGLHTIDMEVKGNAGGVGARFLADWAQIVILRMNRFAAFKTKYVDYGRNGPGFSCAVTEAASVLTRTDGCDFLTGIENPDVADAGGTASVGRDRISLFTFDQVSSSNDESVRWALFDDDDDVDNISNSNDFPDASKWIGSLGGHRYAVGGVYVDEDVRTTSQNLNPTFRVAARSPNTTADFVQALYVSFYTTPAPTIKETELAIRYAGTFAAEFTQLAVRYAGTFDRDTNLSAAIAEALAKISSMSVTVAQLRSRVSDLDAVVAAERLITVGMGASLSGSEYIIEVLNVAIAVEDSLSTTLDAIIGFLVELNVDLNLAITDEAHVIIEPDRPKNLPLVTVTDLETS